MSEANPIKSAIYTGTIRHRRFLPKTHIFEYRVCYFYIDLNEVEDLFSMPLLFSHHSPSLFGFRRNAYLGPRKMTLDEAVRNKVYETANEKPKGPIRILTQLTSFGLSFNPVSFYYCFDESDSRVTHILAEITNTPWSEKYTYVLVNDDGPFDFFKTISCLTFFKHEPSLSMVLFSTQKMDFSAYGKFSDRPIGRSF